MRSFPQVQSLPPNRGMDMEHSKLRLSRYRNGRASYFFSSFFASSARSLGLSSASILSTMLERLASEEEETEESPGAAAAMATESRLFSSSRVLADSVPELQSSKQRSLPVPPEFGEFDSRSWRSRQPSCDAAISRG